MGGVQRYSDDILESFASFPPGPLLEKSTEMTAKFQEYLTTLVNLTESKSPTLSWGSTKLLTLFSTVRIQTNTAEGVINEFLRMLPSLMNTYRAIASNLTDILGDVTCTVKREMTDLETAFTEYTVEFLRGDGNGVRKEVDYEPVMERFQALTKTISRIGKSNKCQVATPAAQDAATLLKLVLGHILICVRGLSGSSEAILAEQKCGAHSLLGMIDNVLI